MVKDEMEHQLYIQNVQKSIRKYLGRHQLIKVFEYSCNIHVSKVY